MLKDYFNVNDLYSSPWSRSVNLMCQLTKGIKYKELYEDSVGSKNRNLFTTIRKNLQDWPAEFEVDADGNSYQVYDRLLLAIVTAEIATSLHFRRSSAPKVTLGSMFYTPRNENPTPNSAEELTNKIVDALDSVFNTSPRDRMRHFCVPFVEIQKGRAGGCDETDMIEFLDTFKTRELKDFFTTHGTKAERKKVKKATDAGILRANKPSIPTIKTLGNGKWCCDGTCVTAPRQDYWCVPVTINGTTACALGSDISPNCSDLKSTKK